MNQSKLKVRTASIRDLGAVERLHESSGDRFTEAPPTARLWSLLSHTLSALVPLVQETMLYVAEDGGTLCGFVQASGRPSGINLPTATTLQVLNLLVAPECDQDTVAPLLIDHLCNQALSRGIHRLFVRLPFDHELVPWFRRQGFRQYATEHVLYSENENTGGEEAPQGLRPVRGRDAHALYNLYRKVTPLGVAQVESPNYREWRSLKGEPILRLSRDSAQESVVDRVEVVGWVALQRSSTDRPHTASFLALPESSLADELADYALAAIGSGPVWSSVRHYDAHMIDALRGRGFTTLLTQSLMVKELAVRIALPEKGLVPSFG